MKSAFITHEKAVKEHNQRAKEYNSYYQGAYSDYEQEIELDILLEVMPKNKEIKILDAAGGNGRLALPLAKKGFSNIYCVDLAQDMLKIGEEKIRFIKGDITNLKDFSDNFFDFSFCFGDALSYCDSVKALKEINRVTKKNAYILVDFKIFYRNLGKLVIKNDKENIGKLLKTRKYRGEEHSYEEINYTIEDIQQVVKKSGLRLLKIMGKETLYQYFLKKESKQLDKLFKERSNVNYFLQLDQKLRESPYFIPLSLEIVGVLTK